MEAPVGFAGSVPPLVLSVLMQTEMNYDTASLKSVSEDCHFTETYVNRVFKKSMGTTVQDYIRQVRIRKADEMVMHTGLSIEEISLRVGYQDVSYFIRQYRKVFQSTPLKRRKERAEQA